MPARLVERSHGGHVISTDPARVDLVEVHRYLSDESYWASGRSFDTQRTAIEHSALVVGADDADGSRVGFARMVTDLAAFAWLADVYVIEPARGAGFGAALVQTIVEHPDVAGVKRQFLATRDAHEPYARFDDAAITDTRTRMRRRGPT